MCLATETLIGPVVPNYRTPPMREMQESTLPGPKHLLEPDMRLPDLTDEAVMADVIANSYKNFHAKGLDYICLERRVNLTRKVYFLNGDVTKIPEVVNPHDHRYSFSTTVLAGEMLDHCFAPAGTLVDDAHVYDRFSYMTPLNGGNGFTYEGQERMSLVRTEYVGRHGSIWRHACRIHTIRMLQDQTVLYLEQGADLMPVDKPTRCWVRKGEPKPDLTGLYDRFTPDEVIARFKTIEDLTKDERILVRDGG